MGDYGGWGLKRGKKGLAYTISGNYGIYLEMKMGKNIMLTRIKNSVHSFTLNPTDWIRHGL